MKRFLLSDRVSIRAVLPQQHKGEAAQHSPEVLSYGLPQEGVKSVNLLGRVQSSFRAAVGVRWPLHGGRSSGTPYRMFTLRFTPVASHSDKVTVKRLLWLGVTAVTVALC